MINKSSIGCDQFLLYWPAETQEEVELRISFRKVQDTIEETTAESIHSGAGSKSLINFEYR